MCVQPTLTFAAGDKLIGAIVRDIQAGRVASIVVYSVPYNYSTFWDLDPAGLVAASKRTIRMELTGELKSNLVLALQRTDIKPSENEPDCRWGLKLLDKRKAVLHEMYLGPWYFGKPRTRAIIDNQLVTVNRPLRRFLEKQFGTKPYEKRHRGKGSPPHCTEPSCTRFARASVRAVSEPHRERFCWSRLMYYEANTRKGSERP
jgi:hypothetical protein